jgi:hypothetical protein
VGPLPVEPAPPGYHRSRPRSYRRELAAISPDRKPPSGRGGWYAAGRACRLFLVAFPRAALFLVALLLVALLREAAAAGRARPPLPERAAVERAAVERAAPLAVRVRVVRARVPAVRVREPPAARAVLRALPPAAVVRTLRVAWFIDLAAAVIALAAEFMARVAADIALDWVAVRVVARFILVAAFDILVAAEFTLVAADDTLVAAVEVFVAADLVWVAADDTRVATAAAPRDDGAVRARLVLARLVPARLEPTRLVPARLEPARLVRAVRAVRAAPVDWLAALARLAVDLDILFAADLLRAVLPVRRIPGRGWVFVTTDLPPIMISCAGLIPRDQPLTHRSGAKRSSFREMRSSAQCRDRPPSRRRAGETRVSDSPRPRPPDPSPCRPARRSNQDH